MKNNTINIKKLLLFMGSIVALLVVAVAIQPQKIPVDKVSPAKEANPSREVANTPNEVKPVDKQNNITHADDAPSSEQAVQDRNWPKKVIIMVWGW